MHYLLNQQLFNVHYNYLNVKIIQTYFKLKNTRKSRN
jgi:hypothetical protein